MPDAIGPPLPILTLRQPPGCPFYEGTCPVCGATIRTQRRVVVNCGDCDAPLTVVRGKWEAESW